MKILKIIVDKLPDSCYTCPRASIHNQGTTCDITDKMVLQKMLTVPVRPVWCPLVQEDHSFRVSEYHEQGYPEIVEVYFKDKWMRYVHFSNELELKINNFLKEKLS